MTPDMNKQILRRDMGKYCFWKGRALLRLSSLLLMLCLGVIEAWGQHPFTLTTADDVTNHTETLYWMESAGADGFYAIPHTNNSNVSTTNMPNLKALWYFMDAGIDNSTQYYYIVNHNTGYYLKLDGTIGSDNTIKIASFGSGGDAFKFSIGGSEGKWIFYPKSGNGNYWVNKKSSNVPYDKYLKSSNYGGSPDDNSKWNFVAKNSVAWAHPFTNSTNSVKHYYTIHNATTNGAAYYMSTDDDSDPYATISSDVDDDKKVWYFVEAASDNTISNLKYCYIVNAVTGKYLKFTGTANGSSQANSLRLYEHDGTETGETENRFQFMVMNAIGTTYSAYAIMPKLEISYYYNQNASLSPSNNYKNSLSNDMKIGIYNDRGTDDNYAHWLFESIDPCADPVIGFDVETKKVTLSSTTTGSYIYYNKAEGSEPADPTRSSTQYVSGIDLTEDASTTVKAVTVKNGNARSNVVSKTFVYMPTITLSGGPYTYDGNAKTPSISSVMVGETPISSSDYDISYENNTDAGTATVTIREKTGNATIIYGTTTFTIAKASITPTVSITGWTYGTPNDPSVSGNDGNGTVTYQYKVKGAGDDTYSNEKPENSGTYLVKAIIAESTNYNGATTDPVEFTISKATFTPTVSITGWAYGESASSPSVSGVPGSVTVTYQYKVQGADDNTYTDIVPTNVGTYTVQATIAETDNYNAASATTDFTISKADINPTVSITSWTYGGTANSPSVSENPGSGTVTYKYKVQGANDNTYSTDVPTNAGTYTVQATIAETGNYNGKTITTDFTISKVALTVTANPQTITYGDEPTNDGVTYSGFVNSETASVLSGTLAYTYNYSQYGDVGSTYTITPSGLSATNYDISYTPGALTVTPKEVGLTWGETSLNYNGSAQAPTATATGLVNNDEVGVTVSGAKTDAGSSYIATASALTGTKARNYELPSAATTTFSINPATLTEAILSETSSTYDGTVKTITVSTVKAGGLVVSENNVYTVSYKYKQTSEATTETDVAASEIKNAGYYIVTITPNTSNLTGSATASYTINPKSIGDETNPADGFTVSIGEGNSLIVKDGETTLTENDTTVTNNGSSLRYSTRRVAGKGNYSGFFTVRNAIANFQNDGNGGTEYSATFVAENAYGPASNNTDNGHALPSGITAYIITSISGNVANAVALDYIPEGVPVVLLSNAASGEFLVQNASGHTAITDAQISNNMLEEVTTSTPDYNDDERTDHYQTAHFNARTIYLLSHNEFVHNMDGYLDKGKVYLNPNHNSGGDGGGGGSRLFINWDETTSIENYPPSTIHHPLSSKWYTLDGRRLIGQPTRKGIYLRDGQKMVVR